MKITDKTQKPVKAINVPFGKVITYGGRYWIVSHGLKEGHVLLVNVEDGAQADLKHSELVNILDAEIILS